MSFMKALAPAAFGLTGLAASGIMNNKKPKPSLASTTTSSGATIDPSLIGGTKPTVY